MLQKIIVKILNIAYLLSLLLFLLDMLPNFDIKNASLKSCVYIFSTYGAIFIFLINIFRKKTRLNLVAPIIGIILLLIVGPVKILFAKAVWKTQTIIYINKVSPFKKIEFQMQDVGALGYNRREVEVIYFTHIFTFVHERPNNIEKQKDWIKVNQDMNELKPNY